MEFKSYVEIEVDVEVLDYTPPVNGRYTGAWENCYPDEPEEISISVSFKGKDITDLLTPSELDRLEQEACEFMRSDYE